MKVCITQFCLFLTAFLDPLFIVKEFFAIRFKNKNDHLGKIRSDV